MQANNLPRIPFQEMEETFRQKLLQRGFSAGDAALSARLFTESSCDGVYSHGVNRFPGYIRDIDNGYIKAGAKPVRTAKNGVLEQWDGKRGPGNLNAYRSMERAIETARENGLGAVALRNTNHWMRGGTYGWQATGEGCLAILWTNTIGIMPPWGGAEPTIGNNPMILAVPRPDGHIVLDFAQSLYSYGKLSIYQKSGEPLPFEGGYDKSGNLTTDASAVKASMRPLPAGLWKGSGLAILLDLFAVILSGGKSTMEISREQHEHDVSQVFFAISPSSEMMNDVRSSLVNEMIEHLHQTKPAAQNQRVRYPGEKTLEIRKENRSRGIPVDPEIWDQILEL